MTEMDRQMNVDKSMEENLLEKKLVENMLNLGHRPPDIMAAITSIYACDTEITEKKISEHLLIIKRQKNLTDEQMKFSTSYEMHETRDERCGSLALILEHLMRTRDRAQIRRENRTMRLMLFCKSCKINRGTLVNVECGHLLCSNCRNKLNACKFCREEIKEVVAVIFGN
ncbi:uncharacterized protein LOC128185818 isoform X1 [Crassostrea angulata]|uniref:RING-type domain-containing protein n=2 Tax=Magallana TaxID=2171616 RepID=A0A8W8MUC6_MAGGI|nr:uncharacterized protein LOC105329996 isoform X2 [Crassostrea gigas]XP_034317345.1 uncharacterized protein LOC105329996 isoform X2 [Crassostrea gigas]XP_052711446.1 uncharacterized protein LOC128185818 isoform X1 [Crassostrea angulata]|eukprot:XP_011429833.1 PREDICTED: uncharacterized protein LOC105329996 isoform X2 [Crassostrea gigas]